MINFKKIESFNASGNPPQLGLAVSYQNNLSPRISYSSTLSVAFVEQGYKNDEKKDLFFDAGFSMRVNSFERNGIFNPYVLAGAGISKYRNGYNLMAPVGLGCQINLTPNIFLLVNSQYRFTVTDDKFNHWVNSVGVAGPINRKKINKIKQVPLPVAVAGSKRVDSDGDGIIDDEDSCRLIVGILKYHGCPPPDRDQDGIEDSLDKCPDKAGTAANGGCPQITSEIKQQINLAATKIFFEIGSYKLLEESYLPLNQVVKILKDNPYIFLKIEGHTDNAGSHSSNQLLSESRAQSVFSFLTNAGINANRLQYRGFGQDRPIADNATTEGKAKNRRVELKVF